MWKKIEPELYFHVKLRTELDLGTKRRISENALYLARIAFKKIYGIDVEFEVLIQEGSVKVRVLATIGAIILFLSQYGSIRSGADYLFRDLLFGFTSVKKQLEHTVNFEEEICVQRRIGVIGRIDRTLVEFEKGRITRQQCIDQLVLLFKVIYESPEHRELNRPLLQYLNIKHGQLFKWQLRNDKLQLKSDVFLERRIESLNAMLDDWGEEAPPRVQVLIDKMRKQKQKKRKTKKQEKAKKRK